MNSTLGYGLVLLGLACAAFSAITGIVTGLARKESALPWVRGGVYGFAAAMVGSNLTMINALLSHDFSVKYVAQVGSRSTPTIFTIISLWSALEGSILFWGAIMGAYLFAFAFTYRKEHGRYMQLSLGVMAAIATFFAFLIAGPANPWAQLPFPPPDGPGPNPLLQNHPLMIIHPPMLYLGYVGMTIPFGIAAGALLRGELGDAWLVPLRKWTLVPWIFLSIGIILGGWWAYAVLGWGGYWAWDPVENASFMPWLTATAFMHSTMVLEKKKALKLWTVALALSSFVLTIVGTFMTRSGVFNSVHSFTQSDIGPTFLVFIAVLLVFCVLLLAFRGHMLVAETQLGSVMSREGSILLNNLVFACLTFVVLIGTLFPIISEGLFDKKLTVGEPYFNEMALPFMLAMLFLMGVGPMLPWGVSDSKTLRDTALLPTIAGLVVAGVCLAFGYRGFMPLTTFALAGFVTVVTLRELLLPAKQRVDATKESWGTAIFVSASRARRRFGGYVVHLGIVVIAVGVAASSSYKSHATATLKPGEQLKIGDYHVRFDGLDRGREPHREWIGAKVTLVTPGKEEVIETPRMNFYERSTDPVGSPSVTGRWLRDVYVSLLSYDTASGSASFNMWIFPLVSWIWYVGIFFLALGTIIALFPEPKRVAA